MNENIEIDLVNYSPSAETKKILSGAQILLLVGPTGSGKDTLAGELLKTGNYHYLVTHTTRPPRHNHGQLEIDGQDYHFISNKKAISMFENKEFVELASIHGNIYGTSVAEFKKAKDENKIVVGDIDVQGVRSYMYLSTNTIAVFLLPPSFKVLLERIVKRYGHSHNDRDIKIRLSTAIFELEDLLEQDYYQVVVNDDLGVSVSTVEHIVAGSKQPEEQIESFKNRARHLIKEIKDYLKQD